jgi:quinoprotein glucose dehydrogenase
MPNHPVLVTIRKDGRLRDVAVAVTKTGHVFVFDRLTGKPVFPVDEVPVASSPLPDDSASPTQPVPRLPAAIALTHVTRRDMFGVLGLDKLWCQHAFDHSRYSGLFTPPGLDPYIELPSTLGGSNWGGAAFDPASNSLIVKASNVGTRLHLVHQSGHEVPLAHSDFMSRPLEGPYGIRGGWFLSPLGIPCTPPPFGEMRSISMDTGAVRWRIPLGQSHRFGLTAPAFLNWGSPNIGGPMTTGGGLVFAAATLDSVIRALDASTGRELWRAHLPAPGLATPMSYVSHGRQYVLIAAGGSAIADTRQGDALIAYALPPK